MAKQEYIKTKASDIDIDTGEPIVNVEVEGYSEMPFGHYDLKTKAIISLLESIDYKTYVENGMSTELEDHYQEIIKTAKNVFGRLD